MFCPKTRRERLALFGSKVHRVRGGFNFYECRKAREFSNRELLTFNSRFRMVRVLVEMDRLIIKED